MPLFFFGKKKFYAILVPMKTAYIFHDAFSDPNSDWYPWMKVTLEAQGYVVIVPQFPTPAGQSYASWKAVFKNYVDTLDTQSIFIGHGIGGTFALRTLEEVSLQIRGLFLVASYTEPLGHVGYDRVNETFTTHTFNWDKIKNNTLAVKVFSGQNDPFVPESLVEHLAQSLGTNLITIPEGGHINTASGFTQCIPLAQGIKEGLGEINKTMAVETEQPEFKTPPTIPVPTTPVQLEPIPTKPSAAHTMYQDMTTLVNSNSGQVTSSLLGKARSDKEEKELQQPLNPKNMLYIFGTLIVMVAIIGMGIFFVSRYLPAQKKSPVPTIPSLIQSELHQNITILGKQSYEVAQAIRTSILQAPNPGSITDIYYTRGNLRASFVDVLESLDLGDDIPPTLTGEFIPAGITNAPVFMHGSASLNGTPAHTLILPITHYDTSFSGFREWEPTLFRDLGIFMNVPESFLKTKLTKDSFHDELVANKNIRVLRYKKPLETTSESQVLTDSSSEPEPTQDLSLTESEDSVETPPVPNFISENISVISEAIQTPQLTSPYQENDFMIGYFFLNDRTVIIIDNLALIPEILTRYANSQIYK